MSGKMNIQYTAATALSKEPSEKLKQLMQLSQTGLINPAKIATYLDTPDMEEAYKGAQAVYSGLLARGGWAAMDAVKNGRVLLLSEELLKAPYLQTAAMLLIAKTANPALFSDVDAEKALAMLSQEAAGSIPADIYWYMGP